MKPEELSVGQALVDKYGNEYVVEEIDDSKSRFNVMPVRVKCTKFLRSVPIQNGFGKYDVTKIGKIGERFWIFESEDIAKGDFMHTPGCLTVEQLKLKD